MIATHIAGIQMPLVVQGPWTHPARLDAINEESRQSFENDFAKAMKDHNWVPNALSIREMHQLGHLKGTMMPNPDFNDSRNIRRDREGHQRLSRHPDDLADSVDRGPLYRHASFDQAAPASQADDTRQAQRDARLLAVEPLADDETRADIRARMQSLSGSTGIDAVDGVPESLEDSPHGTPDKPEGTDA